MLLDFSRKYNELESAARKPPHYSVGSMGFYLFIHFIGQLNPQDNKVRLYVS